MTKPDKVLVFMELTMSSLIDIFFCSAVPAVIPFNMLFNFILCHKSVKLDIYCLYFTDKVVGLGNVNNLGKVTELVNGGDGK